MHQKCDLTVSFLSNQYISENFDIMAVWIHMGFRIWGILQDFLASAKWCYFSHFSSRSPFFKWLFLNEEQHSQWPAHMDLCIEMCSFWILNHQADWNKREFTGLCRLGESRAVLDRPPGGLTKTAPRRRVNFEDWSSLSFTCFGSAISLTLWVPGIKKSTSCVALPQTSCNMLFCAPQN